MKRLFVLPVLLAAAAAMSGCRSQTPAIVVNGVEISMDELDAAIRRASDGGTPTPETMAAVANDAIDVALVEAEFNARELTIDEATTAEATAFVQQQLGERELSEAEFERRVAIEARYRVLAAALAVEADPVVGEVIYTDADVRTFLAEQAGCTDGVPVLYAIQTADLASATELAAGIETPTVFETVALDAGRNLNAPELAGFSGCVPPGVQSGLPELDAAMLTAVPGDIIGPFEVPQGAILVLVSNDFLQYDALAALVREQLAATNAPAAPVDQSAQFQQRARATAKVEIDPRYGTWDPEMGVIAPGVALPRERVPLPDPLAGFDEPAAGEASLVEG